MNTLNYNLHFDSPDVDAGVVSDVAMAGGVILPTQTHSCNVAVIGVDGKIPPLDDTDALISLHPGIAIGVRTADCVPVVIHAPDIHAIAAIHAGWKGSLGGIVSNTVSKLKELGANPALMKAAFGPCICGQCYEVSPEMAEDFRVAGFSRCIIGYRHLDLEAVNVCRLVDAGVNRANIRLKQMCTYETTTLPSWRRSPTPHRLVTWIAACQKPFISDSRMTGGAIVGFG